MMIGWHVDCYMLGRRSGTLLQSQRAVRPVPPGMQKWHLAASVRLSWCGDNLNVSQEATMNWDQIEGNWKQYKSKVQAKWGKLTDDDLDVLKGNRDMLIGKVQEMYGKGRDEAEQEVSDFAKALQGDHSVNHHTKTV
jgi:uncharacterized protein YjbJ (UPF0337 family)